MSIYSVNILAVCLSVMLQSYATYGCFYHCLIVFINKWSSKNSIWGLMWQNDLKARIRLWTLTPVQTLDQGGTTQKHSYMQIITASVAYPIVLGKVMGSILGSNCVIAKHVKSCTYCCYARCATLVIWEGGVPWPQTGATQYHTQLGLPYKGRAIKGLVVCNDWNLEPLDILSGLAVDCYQPSFPEEVWKNFPFLKRLYTFYWKIMSSFKDFIWIYYPNFVLILYM